MKIQKISRSCYSTHALVFEKYGSLDQLRLKSLNLKKPSSNEVKVDFIASPMNPADINQIQGVYPILPNFIETEHGKLAIGGNEGFAKVTEVGDEVKNLKVGSYIFPNVNSFGTWRESAICKESDLISLNIKEDSVFDPLLAAALTVNPCTAYRMLLDFVTLEKGDVILQNGATSGVGQAVIQLAKIWGIKSVNVIRNRFILFDMLESPKFLLKKDKQSDCLKVLKNLSDYNDVKIDLKLEDLLNPSIAADSQLNTEEFKFDDLRPLFSKDLRTTTILVFLIWSTSSLAYSMFYSFLPKFLISIPNYFGPELDLIVISLSGIPGSVIASKLVETELGRKGTLFFSTIFTSLSIFFFMKVKTTIFLLICNCTGAFFSNLMYGVIYSYTPEVFPTSVRGSGCGIASSLNRVMGIIGPLLSGYLISFGCELSMYICVIVF
ncbi:hypothetical protein HK099_005744, partial [Clydaea vesicula]